MKYLIYGHQHSTALLMAMWREVHGRVSRWFVPRHQRAHRASQVRRWIPLVVLCLSLVVQGVLLYIMGELIDLCISLMELWAELARKHMELTL